MLDILCDAFAQSRCSEDKETRRRGDKENRVTTAISLSPCLPVSCLAPRCNGASLALAYNTAMPQSRTTTGIFLVVLLAVIGYVLVTMPHAAGRRVSTRRTQISPWVGVRLPGGRRLRRRCCSAALLLAILIHIWKNTRQKSADRERRNLSPSEMSAGEQDAGVRRQSGRRAANSRAAGG